ncbi:hypothetical protein ABZU09_00175 [Lactobacillus mulieris]|uniref:hypothetical protein n=1 Tax=Lactobacillus mulieris TaxID=2508708 RepID=UPI000558540B|nr:hypothetical protein [Lactobacillus mulieris]KAA9366889.1 hypothetical protein F6I07_08075 [Lactobacillus jensenii]MCW8073361.1 hypothetical protein [Lactobacillus mulieris]MCW8105979.1 hypothetical protein [Lactobacillus mulieris]MDK6268947.1 hypothetical protein [Lactobacillus mulieris]MDK6564650.1 hypothetical protein [Lactobacillus mulieris]
MNERIRLIVSLLLTKPDIKTMEMMQELNLTRKQVNYAIKILNFHLYELGVTPIKRKMADLNFLLK